MNKSTLFRHSPLLEELFGANKHNLSKGIHHGEDHPDVDHLDVRCCWKALADADEAGGERFNLFGL